MQETDKLWELDSITIPLAEWDLDNLIFMDIAKLQGRVESTSITIDPDKGEAHTVCTFHMKFVDVENKGSISSVRLAISVNHEISFSKDDIRMDEYAGEIYDEALVLVVEEIVSEMKRIGKSAGLSRPLVIERDTLVKVFTETLTELRKTGKSEDEYGS